MTTTGLQEMTYPRNLNLTCSEQGEEWRVTNTEYHGSRNTDPVQQGNYTKEGKLMIGHYCK